MAALATEEQEGMAAVGAVGAGLLVAAAARAPLRHQLQAEALSPHCRRSDSIVLVQVIPLSMQQQRAAQKIETAGQPVRNAHITAWYKRRHSYSTGTDTVKNYMAIVY